MVGVDGRPSLNAKDDGRSGQKKSVTDLQREKRKSEVLIAAQSIENEVQSVKSLKRISIGSIDLLIDPEMEFRINSPNVRKSWSSNSSSSGEEADAQTVSSQENGPSALEDENEDTLGADGLEASFDTTSADYLQGSESFHDSSDVISSSGQYKRSDAPQRSVRRMITGVGSLRRGGVSTAASDDSSSTHVNNASSGNTSLTKQLFWVPANQHPNVKPENYLELVQDTLHSIHLDDKDENLVKEGEKTADVTNFERMPIDLARKRESLVRRPSRLRKSYTEFEEYNDDEDTENRSNFDRMEKDQLKGPSQSNRGSRRAVSLKDITEELNRISNNAGLTSSDAITLARTLSMAGSYSNSESDYEDDSATQERHKESKAHDTIGGKNEDEGEFASNMLMRHGVVIPARSSLRRSKFNTYRIRSSGSVSSLTDEGSDEGNHGGVQNGRKVVPSRGSRKEVKTEPLHDRRKDVDSNLSAKQTESALSSPNTINDFQDIYDHYRQTSIDWEKELDKEPLEQSNDPFYGGSQVLGENENVSSESLPKTQGSKLSDAVSIAGKVENRDSTTAQSSSEKKSGWSWLNGIKSRDQAAGKQTKAESKADPQATNDFEKTSELAGSHSEKPASHRSNHSKNRHLPIFNAGETGKPEATSVEKEPTSSNKQSSSSSSDSSNLKRQKFEKKFVNLFKRKPRSKSAGSKVSENSINGVVVTNTSEENASKPGKLQKSHTKLKSESGAEEHLRKAQGAVGRDPCGGDADRLAKQESEANELPILQPAVSVTSTKSNHGSPMSEPSVVESVRELDGDDSQDLSADQSADSGIDLMQEALRMKEATGDVQANENPGTASVRKYVLPPRKLTFDDVQRPDRPNAAMNFTDSAFGFPLPMLTVSTVIMFDHRLPINVERAIYRLSHLKLSDPKRELRQQVILSNFMYAYLNLVNHTLYMEQAAQEKEMDSTTIVDKGSNHVSTLTSNSATYKTEHNSANGSICIPDI